MEQSDKLLEKIRALLRMAEHPGSNPYEAAVALEKAQALLLEHNLERAQVVTGQSDARPDDTIGMVDLSEPRAVYPWRIRLCNTIAKSSLCHVVGTQQKGVIHLFGTRTNVRVVLEMYYWIAEQLERISNEEYRAYKADEGTAAKTAWRNAFFLGALGTLKTRLDKPYQTFAATTGRELVLVNDKALQVAAHKVFPTTGKGNSWRPRAADGFGAGQSAGRNVSMSRPSALSAGRALGAGR